MINENSTKTEVLEAVGKCGDVLIFASDKLRNDRDVVVTAVKQHVYALQYAGAKLKRDRNFMLEVVKNNGLALAHASKKFRADREVVLVAVKQEEWAFRFASDELKDDFHFLLQALKTNNRVWLSIKDDVRFDSLQRFYPFDLAWERDGNFDNLFNFMAFQDSLRYKK